MTPAEFEKGLTLTGVGLGTAFVVLALLFVLILLIYGGVTLFNRLAARRASALGEGGDGVETAISSADGLPEDPEQVKQMVAAVAAAVAVGSSKGKRISAPPGTQPSPEGSPSTPEGRWRTFGRQEIMHGRQVRGGWRK